MFPRVFDIQSGHWAVWGGEWSSWVCLQKNQISPEPQQIPAPYWWPCSTGQNPSSRQPLHCLCKKWIIPLCGMQKFDKFWRRAETCAVVWVGWLESVSLTFAVPGQRARNSVDRERKIALFPSKRLLPWIQVPQELGSFLFVPYSTWQTA